MIHVVGKQYTVTKIKALLKKRTPLYSKHAITFGAESFDRPDAADGSCQP